MERYVGVTYTIYEKNLDNIVLSNDFRYQTFIEHQDAIEAIRKFGLKNKRYLILSVYAVTDWSLIY